MIYRALVAVLLSLSNSASAQTLEERVQQLEQRLNAVPKQAPTRSAFNPSIGMAVDLAARNTDSDKGNFQFRAAEVNIEAPIDPYSKGWAIINAHPGEVEIEEAVLQTTALPYNLTVRGGRVFAAFGRLTRVHGHELPFVDRPKSADEFMGGEARADGLELSWLAPTPFYLNLTLGGYNRLGAENERKDDDPRHWDEFTYLARGQSALEFGDHTVDFGISSAWTPKRGVTEDTGNTGSLEPAIVTRKNTWRVLHGLDMTYRWQPAAGGLYKGLTWGTEVFQNTERRFDEDAGLPTDRVRAYGGYSYVQFKLGRNWRPGAMVDLTQDQNAPRTDLSKTFSGFLTYDVTEFQKLRVQYLHTSGTDQARRAGSTVALQWSVILGHHVHGFRDR